MPKKTILKNEVDFEISFFTRLVKSRPRYVHALIPLAEAYTKKGFYEKGLQIDKRLSKLCKDDPLVHYNLACSYALTGQNEDAFSALFTAIKLGYSDFKHLGHDPDLKSLKTDPRFKKLLALTN